jgi:predicted MFS family arabinose efflux permease
LNHLGFRVGFVFSSAVALAALFISCFWMPETRELRGTPADLAG